MMNADDRGRKRPLARLLPEEPRTWHMAAFDFETDGLHGAAVFGTLQWELTPDGERSDVIEVRTPAEMLAAMCRANVAKMRWYAHHAEYDLIYLIDAARELQATGEIGDIIPLLRGDSSIFMVTFRVRGSAPLVCYDSMAIATNGGQGISLDKLAEAMSTVGRKLKVIDFNKEKFNPRKKAHREYAKQDTRILLDSMVNFNRAFHEHYGVNISGTISATALKAWQTTLSEDHKFWRLEPDREQFARDAYFGGLAFLTSTRKHKDVVSLDVNSMYPHCMRTFGIPAGEMRYCTKYEPDIADGGWRPAPGLYLAEFQAPPDMTMGCVPYRDDTGMCFPRGRFKGWTWSIEIARALRWGYRVKVEEGFCWSKIEYPFSDFVTLCERKRAEYKGQGVEMIIKTAQNSLYGKFGTKPDGMELRVTPGETSRNLGPREAYTAAEDIVTRMLADGWLIPEADLGGRSYFWQRPEDRSAFYMYPHWSGWITAQARGILFDAIEAVREVGGEVICGDTDSLKLERRWVDKVTAAGRISIGKEYGQWKVDAEYREFRAYAPKCYSYIAWGPGKRRGGGGYHGKAKGIPAKMQSEAFHRGAFRGKSPRVKWQSAPNLLSVLKGKPNKLVPRHRVASVLDHSDNWTADAAGAVRSVEIRNGARVKTQVD